MSTTRGVPASARAARAALAPQVSGRAWHPRARLYPSSQDGPNVSASPGIGGAQHRQRRRGGAAPRAAKNAGASAAGLSPGQLVAFSKDGKAQMLGLVTAPNGKAQWFVVDTRGHKSSVPPKAASLVLPGGSYTPDDLERFAAAAAGADASLLEIAWAIAAEDDSGGGGGTAGAALSLPELAALLYDADGAMEQWTTFWLLQQDRVYFKQSSGKSGLAYQARSPDAVKAAQEVLEQERRKEEERAAFAAAAAAARGTAAGDKPGWEAWVAGPFGARVKAIKELALSGLHGCSAAAAELAKDSLALLGVKSDPPALAWALLADLGAARLHDPLPLLRAGARLDFEADVEAAAQAIAAAPPPDPDAAMRRDLTHLRVFTVDDAGTTEVDDGLSIEQLPSGDVKLWVHVADPTRWLQPGSVVDAEARARTRTLYLPFGSIPMFPAVLAEGAFSLRAAEDGADAASAPACCALSVGATLAGDGSLSGYEVVPSFVKVTNRLTYDEADADIALGPEGCAHEDLQSIYQAARLRKAWRAARGAIDIDLPEAKFEVPSEDLASARPSITITPLSQWESAARVMVAELMILAGEAAGDFGRRRGLPLPFRGQEAPLLPDEAVLAALPDGPCRGYALRRCMTRSVMEPAAVPHASLALDAYVQVTSPIRRYSDMLAHWNIKAALREEAPPFGAAQLASILAAAGETGRELGRAENETYKYWAAEFMRQRLGESFEATVLGMFRPEAGLAAILLEPLGLETITKLPWTAAPGERILVSVVDSDTSSGFYRLSFEGELDSPLRRERLAAAEAAEAAAAAAAEEALGSEEGGSSGGWEMAGSSSEPSSGGGGEGGSEVDSEMEAIWAAVEAKQQQDDEQGGEGGEINGSGGGAGERGGAKGSTVAAAAAAAAVGLLATAADVSAAALDHAVAHGLT